MLRYELMKDFNFKMLFAELNKNKGLLRITLVTLVISTIILFIVFLFWTDILILFSILGFVATLYSIILTMILYNFLNIADAEFLLSTQKYVETNKEKITKTVENLSNFMNSNLRVLKSNGNQDSPIVIPAEIHDDFRYMLSINKKFINERTVLYQCRESFKTLETLIKDTKVIQLNTLNEIENEEAEELTQQLVDLLIELNTIFQ